MKTNLTYLIFGLILAFTVPMSGCNEDDQQNQSDSILLLQIDYVTSTFEGGKELKILPNISDTDSIPILVDYKEPLDFGSIALYYQPTDQLIFDGTIIWSGKGRISYPTNFDLAESFLKLNSEIEQPGSNSFQTIFYPLNQPIDLTNIWKAVNQLKIVNDYLKSNKKIGLFLYTPSIGLGDPNDWDWFMVLMN